MNKKWLIVISLAVLLVPVVATHFQKAGAATTRSFTLYGNLSQGWGFTSDSMTSPGPTIEVEQGDTVNLTLVSNDTITHIFFVSYTNSSTPNPSDPQSPGFSGTTIYSFTASSTVGTYTYYCAVHPGIMYGYFMVVPTGTIPELQPMAILLLLVATMAAAALVHKGKRKP